MRSRLRDLLLKTHFLLRDPNRDRGVRPGARYRDCSGRRRCGYSRKGPRGARSAPTRVPIPIAIGAGYTAPSGGGEIYARLGPNLPVWRRGREGLGSAHLAGSRAPRRRSPNRTDIGRSASAAGTGLRAPCCHFTAANPVGSLAEFLVLFDTIFTLNQDLLPEKH